MFIIFGNLYLPGIVFIPLTVDGLALDELPLRVLFRNEVLVAAVDPVQTRLLTTTLKMTFNARFYSLCRRAETP